MILKGLVRGQNASKRQMLCCPTQHILDSHLTRVMQLVRRKLLSTFATYILQIIKQFLKLDNHDILNVKTTGLVNAKYNKASSESSSHLSASSSKESSSSSSSKQHHPSSSSSWTSSYAFFIVLLLALLICAGVAVVYVMNQKKASMKAYKRF
jgi:cobalamin biosynthesis Mg chelatase CobN